MTSPTFTTSAPAGRGSRRPAGRAGSAAPIASRRTGSCPRRCRRPSWQADRGRGGVDLGDDGELPARRAVQRPALGDAGELLLPVAVLHVGDLGVAGRASRGGGRRRSGPRAAAASAICLDRRIERGHHRQARLRRAPSRRRRRSGCGGPPRRRSRRCTTSVAPRLRKTQLLGLGRLLLLGGDVAVVAHAAQHIVAPRVGFLLVAHDVVAVGRLGQRREIGDLRQRQLVERAVEVVERRRRRRRSCPSRDRSR